jgi:hypothetical protein
MLVIRPDEQPQARHALCAQAVAREHPANGGFYHAGRMRVAHLRCGALAETARIL